jgi:gliding motility-associated-like protein
VGLCASIVIQVIDLPVATAPASTTAMVCAGTTGTLTVTPVSNVASYQWRVRNGVSWSDITGQTTATLSRAAADLQTYPAENEYSVVLKNSLGCEQTLTGLKILSFTQPAIGTAGQPAGVTVCAGANTAFQVNATGTSLVYQWQVDAGSGFTNITNGGVYAGSTTARLELTGATAALNGYQYRALVKTVVGGNTICNAVESNPAVLTINTGPSINPGGQPANISICPNGTATFSVAASSYVTPTYQWQENTGTGFADLADGGSYSGVTTATLSISGVASTWTGRRYRVVIQNACGPVTSDGAATLSVTSGVSIRGQPASAMACPGSTANFQVSATMGGLTYQWQEDSGSGFQNLAASGTYSGVVSSTLVINNVSTSLNGRRYRVVIQSSGCASVNSDGAAVLTVNTPPAIVNQPSDVVLCLGESNNMTVAATGPAVTYQWQAESGGNFTDIIEGSVYSGAHAGTLAILQPPGSMNGYRFRAVLKWACGEVTSAPAVLSINLPPDISAGPDKTIEQRGSVVLEGTVPSGVVTYEWMELAGTPQANEILPEVTPATDTYYTLSATDSHGCTATDQVMVAVTPLFNIPNAFSPNHDGVNDAWVINGLEQYPNARIKVFNRYGAPVFALENQPVSWDGSCQGKPLPWGTYYYTIDLQDGHKPLSGWVLIMN